MTVRKLKRRVRALLRRLRNWWRLAAPTPSCVHGSDPGRCLDCRDVRGWDRDVYGPLPSAVLPGEDAWVDRLNDIWTDAEAER